MMQRFHRLSPRGKAAVVAMILLACSGVLWGAVHLGRRAPTVPTTQVQRAEFLDAMQIRGEVKALKSVTISAPAEAGDLQIVKISPEGTVVKPGDVIVEFDKTKTERDLEQFRSTLKSAEAEIGQAKAQAKLAEEQNKTGVLKAHYDVETSKLDASKQEIVSRIEGEEAKLKLADSQQKLSEAEAKEKSDKALNDATIRSKIEASKKAQYDAQRAERVLGQMTLRAPSAGTISILSHWAGMGFTVYKPGDHAWAGAAIAELPDPNTLRLSARVDETERGRMALKQPVIVQFGVIPDRQFTGHIEQISSIASMDFSSGWPITRNFTVEVAIDQTDPRFKPGITGDVTVIIEKVPNAVTMPAQALFQKSGQNVVYVWQGGQFEERAIDVGRRSGDKIMVAKGVAAGDQVALRDPTAKE
ncbi:MAG TPA: HlyD family efflux transporter periplasmic adaptor subunit [Candidatus Sulfotelmatobacter sp.]|jgi:RND family efflux transporter MFP subunit